MSRRIMVSTSCAKRCPSCAACNPDGRPVSLEEVSADLLAGGGPIVLGGGDATRWPHLQSFLTENARLPEPRQVWVEGPALSFSEPTLRELAAQKVTGIRVQVEALGEKMVQALGVGDGERVVAGAEALGLATEIRACVRPKTFAIVAPLARRLSPRPIWLEIYRQDFGKAPTTLDTAGIDDALVNAPHVKFSAHRLRDRGYLPPCVMPATWRSRQGLWQSVFAEQDTPNAALPACGDCVLSRRCRWNDPGALSDAAIAAARPVRSEPPVRRIVETPVPEIIVRKRRLPEVVCTEPWTTMEDAGHEGKVHQCGGNWTSRLMGNIHENTLMEIWNGKPFQEARRLMGQATVSDLCKPICTRLYDGVLAEKKFTIQAGSEAFVKNQLVLAEEIAERKEILKGMPRHMTICPSSYCNYDCVFCDYGRRPRVDMPDRIWEELPLFMPTLKTLTLLGGEPLANPRVWEFLTTFDTARFPDLRLDIFTNGALMTEKALRRVKSSALGEITVSLNSGLPGVYEAIERATVPFDQVVANLDALIRFRDEFQWWFGITVSLIVMRENAHTLIAFGELALKRNLHIRLVGLLIARRRDEVLNFYKNPDEVRVVIEHLDRFTEWARRVGRPDYVQQAVAAREAVLGNAAKATGLPVASLTPLRFASSAAG